MPASTWGNSGRSQTVTNGHKRSQSGIGAASRRHSRASQSVTACHWGWASASLASITRRHTVLSQTIEVVVTRSAGAGHFLYAQDDLVWCGRCGLNATQAAHNSKLCDPCRTTCVASQRARLRNLQLGKRPESAVAGQPVPLFRGASPSVRVVVWPRGASAHARRAQEPL